MSRRSAHGAEADAPLADLPLREGPPVAGRATPPPRPNGLVIWLAAAASLVAGIIIGFMTGYTSGQRAVSANPGQTFSEAAVVEPTRVDPEPVVVAEERADRSNVPNVPNVSNVPTPGSIEVLSRPAGAQVILDGRPIGRTPLSIPGVAAGAHSVRVELPGYNRWATSVDVTPGARARVAASLEQP